MESGFLKIYRALATRPKMALRLVGLAIVCAAVGVKGCVWFRRAPEPAPTGWNIMADVPPALGELDPFDLVGECETPGWPRDALLFGDLALVALNRDGLCWVDLADPARPRVVQHWPDPRPIQMRRVDDRVFMATLAGGVALWDFSAPTRPVEIDTEPTTRPAVALAVLRDHVYAACGDAGMVAMEWNRKGGDESLRTVARYHPGIQYARNIVPFDRRRLLVSDSVAGRVHVVDVRRPESPRQISFAQIPEHFIDHVTVAGETAFLSTRHMTAVLDYRRLKRPRLVGILWRGAEGKVTGTTHRDDLLYILREDAGVDIYDIRRPRAPVYIAHSHRATGVAELSFHKDLIVATCWDRSLRVYRQRSEVGIVMEDR